MQGFLLFSLLLNLFVVFVISFVIYLAIKPAFAAETVSKYLDLKPQIEERDDVVIEENPDERDNEIYKIWYWVPGNVRKDRFVLFIPGGAFIATCPTLNPFRSMENLNQGVVTFNYPNIIVRKSTRNKDMVIFCIRTVAKIIRKMQIILNNPDVKCTLIGHSAGVYFCVRVLTTYSNESDEPTTVIDQPFAKNSKQKIKIANIYPTLEDVNTIRSSVDKFIGICGYYGAKSVNNNILKILDKLYLNDKPVNLSSYIATKRKEQLQSSDLLPQLPSPTILQQLYITCTDDFLRDSTMTYTSQTNSGGVLTYTGEHNLFHRPENDKAKQMYKDIVAFVNSDF